MSIKSWKFLILLNNLLSNVETMCLGIIDKLVILYTTRMLKILHSVETFRHTDLIAQFQMFKSGLNSIFWPIKNLLLASMEAQALWRYQTQTYAVLSFFEILKISPNIFFPGKD